MEMRPGYKQTEVGVIPDDWLVTTVGQIADVGRGRVISHREIAKSVGPTYPVYSSQTSNEGVMGYLDTFEFDGEYITWTTDGANAGTVFYRNGRFNCTNVCGTIKLRSDDTYFVAKALAVVAPKYVSRNLGNPKLMNDVAKQILFALPATATEQRAIAAALSDVDALLAKLGQLIAKKRGLKQATMQQLLTGKTRLPGFRVKWVVKRIVEICQMKSGEGITSANIDDQSKFPCYGGNGLRGFTTRYTHDGSYALIGRQGALCGNVLGVEGKFFASEHAIVVTPLKETDIRWLVVVLASMNLNQYSESSAQPGLSVIKLLSLSVEVPPFSEQSAIATVLSDMDAEITALQASRDKTRDLKRGMMQELLTGKIRFV